jgi:hypothetical protein
MKKKSLMLLMIIVSFIGTSVYAQDVIPAKKMIKYFAKHPLSIPVSANDRGAYNCNTNVIAGQNYSGIVAAPFVGFSFSSVYLETSKITPPSMGLGYIFSFGTGVGQTDGSLLWSNQIGIGVCVTSGFKPIGLSSMPANIGVYAIWKNMFGVGFYYDTLNHLAGLSVGMSINLTTISSSIYNIKCLN